MYVLYYCCLYSEAISYIIHHMSLNSDNCAVFLARLFEEKKSSYCRHSGVSVWVV